MHRGNTDIYLKKIGDKAFCEVFKSMQLLGFTVLYYNFDYDTARMTDFNNRLHAKNNEILDNLVTFDSQVEIIEKKWNCIISNKVKEFPYRARVKMMGGLPKRSGNLQAFNMVNLQSFSAIESFIVLAFSTLMEMDKKFGKVQMDIFWSNLLANAENYSKGMTDEFVCQYFIQQIGLQLNG